MCRRAWRCALNNQRNIHQLYLENMMRKYGMAAAVMIAVMAKSVSGQGLAGTWNTTVDVGMRIENGVETSMGTRPAIMMLTVKGDSVLGTWVLPADGSSPAIPANKVRGMRNGNKVTLTADPIERTRNINGETQSVKLVASYAFELKGDVLEGTTRVSAADGSFATSDRPFTAKRAKP
jgi:hypothetical protein